MRSIDTSRSGTISFCGTRSEPDERSGDRSGCQVSSQKQTTVKIRCIVDSPNIKADSEADRPQVQRVLPGVWQRFATNLATWPQLFDPEEIMDSILFAG